MIPMISTNYDTCEPFLLPSPPTVPEIPYVPKIIFSNNTTRMVLTSDYVREVIQRSVMENPCNQRYQFLTQREVRLVKAQEPMARIELFLNPDQVFDGEVKLILRNDGLNNFSVFSLLPRENRPMAEASSPKSNDGTQASASGSADASMSVQEDQQATSSQAQDSSQRLTCQHCNKQLSSSYTLKIHEARHSGKKLYSCPICSERFFHYKTMLTHKRKHTGEKPYQCSICGKCYVENHGLKHHMAMHSAVIHKCPVCHKPYKCYTSIYKHVMDAHPGQMHMIYKNKPSNMN